MEEERRLSSQSRPHLRPTSAPVRKDAPLSFGSPASEMSDEALAKMLQQQEEQQERYRLAHGSRRPLLQQFHESDAGSINKEPPSFF